MPGEVRQRRNNKKRSSTTNSKNNSSSNRTEKQRSTTNGVAAAPNNKDDVKVRRTKKEKEPNEEQETSLWSTFTSHPLIQALPWILILLAFQAAKQGMTKVTLQYPDVINQILPFVSLRPSVGATDARQVLIVGAIHSGLAQVTTELSTKLGGEVGHGNSDAQNYYVRDGTASWFHVMRFLPARPTANNDLAFFDMCKDPPRNMGFHPRMYEGSSECSNKEEWSSCWAKSCFRILRNEWGCSRRLLDDGGCKPSFAKVLHQIRNPLTMVEDLIATYCEAAARNEEFDGDDDDDDGVFNGVLSSTFVTFNNAMFTNGKKGSFSDYSCIEGASYHVIEHTKAMILAREEGLVDAVYKFEESIPCDVAELAGFRNKSTALYEPNYATTVVKCAFALDPARDRMTITHKQPTSSSSNKGRVSLEWSDLEGGKHGSARKADDMRLVKEMKQLMNTLGYDPDSKREPSD